MIFEDGILKNEEAAVFSLRSLYQKYGYSRFKMSKFEEYDLYVRNKDFLISEGIITFMDNDGKLLALKPDVTLSIVKNFIDEPKCVQKVYYNENVYRMSKGTKSFKEIMQTGLECIGDIDLYDICEVIMLAAKSLEQIDERYMLDISHLGVISSLTDAIDVPSRVKADILRCIGEKNVHELEEICEKNALQPELKEAFYAIINSYGRPGEVIARLKEISLCQKISAPIRELEDIFKMLELYGILEHISIDFSIVNDMSYYSGVVFRGFIEGLPSGILSGGCYDNLLRKMKKTGGAIGFAVYLDMLERLDETKKDYDVDALVIYGEDAPKYELAQFVEGLTKKGMTVLCERAVPKNIRYRNRYDFLRKDAVSIDESR
ncbi:MAG: ATP phosphoribosyltransferase regulatory subunit [Lachnospiraceae bacterium]